MIQRPTIYYFQLASVTGIWLLLAGIIYWLTNSLIQSYEHADMTTGTTVIVIIGMCVFCTLVGVLTYVFVGLQRGRKQ